MLLQFFLPQQSVHPSTTTILFTWMRTSRNFSGSLRAAREHSIIPGHFRWSASLTFVVSFPVLDMPEQVTSTVSESECIKKGLGTVAAAPTPTGRILLFRT